MSDVNKHGLDSWAAKIANSPDIALELRTELAASLRGDKSATLAMLTKLTLPCFAMVETDTDAFLADPAAALFPLRTPTLYASLYSSADKHLERVRDFGFDAAGATAFIERTANQDSRYDRLILMESARMQYGGNIVVGTGADNSIYSEVAFGMHSQLVAGALPFVTVRRDPLKGRFVFSDLPPKFRHNSFDETDIRTGIHRAIMAIPNEQREDHGAEFESRGRHFHPGYYEFGLVQLRENGPLSPIFIEYSKEKPFVFDEP
jgi:hypothetical protein